MKNKLVQVENKQAVTTSRKVAEVFEKRHADVLDIIEKMKTENSVLINMFFEISYKVEGNRKSYKEYLMNRDGFSLLVMGFTGTKALQWKIKYIEAFNKMEEAIKPKLPQTYAEALRAYADEVEAKEKLQLENKQQAQMIGELKPKADYTDLVLKSTALVTITQIAKDYGMSGKELNQKLHDFGIQYKQSGQWLLYSNHHAKGYTHSETINITHKDGTTGTVLNTKWTQKGRLFLYQKLKKNHILPVIEREFSEELAK